MNTNTITLNLTLDEFKVLLRETVRDVVRSELSLTHTEESKPFTIEEAAKFLRLKITTLYEKTSKKLIPHFKRGNKLYFYKEELMNWIRGARIKTDEEIETEAQTYALTNKK